ncbi:uncharacterized protein ARMOST_10622 [Armillaria ostoyae]|uniref:Uncharacterized protein n=1 Tax=Armillaria ostoyae TaxID=47428 RepID=A0A284REU4_ARMOS|nr:uncharacterized protein ARMOST_10622 [Armillaria ostoyae]
MLVPTPTLLPSSHSWRSNSIATNDDGGSTQLWDSTYKKRTENETSNFALTLAQKLFSSKGSTPLNISDGRVTVQGRTHHPSKCMRHDTNMTLEGRRDLDDTTGLIHYCVLLMLSAEDKEHGRCLGVYHHF